MLYRARFPLFFLLSLVTPSVFAGSAVPDLLSESIYLFELIVIAIVALALIMVAISIIKSRNKVSKMVAVFREEMSHERALLEISMNAIKVKEKQISYMTRMLQEHLESLDYEVKPNSGRKKEVREELVVEVID